MSYLVQAFREKTSKMKNHSMKSEATPNIGYPTGFLSFDFANGVQSVAVDPKTNAEYTYYSIGIADGSMVMIIGRSGCGKTTWAMQAAAAIIKPYALGAIFHENIEGGISDDRIRTLTGLSGEELGTRYIHRNEGVNAESFYERMKIIHDLKTENREQYLYDTGLHTDTGVPIFKMQPTVVILDSLAMLMPAKYTEEEEISGQMSSTAAARMNSMLFKRVIPMLKAANIILIVINHINQSIAINPMQKKAAQIKYLKQDESLPGGNTPLYLSNLMIKAADHTKLKEDEGFGIDGSLVDFIFIKSRNGKSNQEITLVFNQETGFDREFSLLYFLKEVGAINGAGSSYYIGENKTIKFAQKNFKSMLMSNPEFKSIFLTECMMRLKQLAPLHIDTASESMQLSDEMLAMVNVR